MRSRKQESGISYLHEQKECIVLLLLATGIGVFLGGAQKQNMALFYSLYAFVDSAMPSIGFMQSLVDSLVVYGVQLGAVVLSMHFDKGAYVAKALLLCIGSIYAFTSTVMFMLYGGRGLVVIALSYTVQMLVLMAYIIHVLYSKKGVKIKANTEYMVIYIESALVIIALAVYNSYMQPLFDKIILSILHR